MTIPDDGVSFWTIKIQLTTSPLLTSEDMATSTMGMDASGMEMAQYFLRDKIYSDKILAVVREYPTNALDEHKKYGIIKPVEISLTHEKFIVRDHAKGLDEHGIRNIFGMYFKSTKTKENDSIGGFGIGSKSFFSYTDSFYVKSFFEGVCTTYLCALGGGNKGIPVGQILKIGEEPTEESGLEISGEIKTKSKDGYPVNDYGLFNKRIVDMVSYLYPHNVVYKGPYGIEQTPKVPVHEKTINGYTFRLIENNLDAFIYTMGGVVYKTKSDIKGIEHLNVKENHCIVIDIPIGKMSLPISRESFEDTPANNRVLEEIREALIQLADEDTQVFNDVTIPDLLKTMSVANVTGDWFTASKRKFYKDFYNVLVEMHQSNIGSALPCEKTADGKFLVALLPDKRSYDDWRMKFMNHSQKLNKNFYYVRENYVWDSAVEKLKEYFTFKNFKTVAFSWPKPVKSAAGSGNDMERSYVVSIKHGRYNTQKYTVDALELHNMMRKELSLPIAETEEDALEQMDLMVIDDLKVLDRFSITAESCDVGKRCNSQKMVDNMKTLGWFEYYDDNYKQIRNTILEKEKKRQEAEQLLREAKLVFLKSGEQSKTDKRFRNNPKRAMQYATIVNNLKKESSIRGKVFNSLSESIRYYAGDDVKLSRNDLRQILSMK